MTVPVQQVYNVLRTYEKAFKPIPPPPVPQPPVARGDDRVSISQEAVAKRGEVARR